MLRQERTEIPDPPAGAVRVRVAATGLNPADWALCRFMAGPLPRGIGCDVAGTVDAVGPGTTVLIHGAGGMVGYGAVQVARDLGARVIATAGPTYAADLKGFGAAVTSYGEGMVDRVRELADGPVDLVLDAAPPTPGTIETLIELVERPEQVVTISNHDDARGLGARVNLDVVSPAQLSPPAVLLADDAARVMASTFHLPIADTFALDDWRAAAELSLSGRPRGKVVLLPGGAAHH